MKRNSGAGERPGPHRLRAWAATAALLVLSGCAGVTTFTSYPNKINPLIANVEGGRSFNLGQCLTKECQSKDLILYNMERGRLAQIFGDIDSSKRDFTLAIEKIRENEQKAMISASRAGANLAAAAVNDNAIPYQGRGYERVMLHHYQALNFLNQRDVEGAGVEVRCANQEQEEALRRHEQEIEKAAKEAEEKKIGGLLENSEFVSRYAQLDELAGQVKNSFQNAYTFYLSGLIYEILNQPGDAYIDYKKALEIYPGNRYLQEDVLRLAKALDMQEEFEAMNSRLAADADRREATQADAGELVVLFEDGFVPQKEEVKIPIPLPSTGIVAVAFPIYNARLSSANPLLVKQQEQQLGATEPICDMRALAVKALKEEVPLIATRQIVRAAAKGAATSMAKEKMGPLGSLALSAWNLLSENADLRSWITLPADAQILRAQLPAGTHRLTLSHHDSRAESNIEVDIKRGSKTILHVVRARDQLYSSSVTF